MFFFTLVKLIVIDVFGHKGTNVQYINKKTGKPVRRLINKEGKTLGYIDKKPKMKKKKKKKKSKSKVD
jgi:hypothetical protein